MDKIRLIQIGLGGWGRRWAEVVTASSEFRPVAYVSRRGTQAGQDRAVFTRLEDALRHVDADALLVTTPCFRHVHDSCEGLSAGLHVLVEKPMADSMTAAWQMLAESRRSGKILMVAEDFRYNPAPRTVRKILADGSIGQPDLIQIEYFRPHDFPAGDWRNELEHPLLLENGVHHFDLLRYITGAEAEEIWATTWQAAETGRRNTGAAVAVKLSRGITAVYTGAWAYAGAQTDWLGRWKIAAGDGIIRWDGGAMGQIQVVDPDGLCHDVPLVSMECRSQAAVLAEFGRALRAGTSPETDATDNMKSFQIAMVAIESADCGHSVSIQHRDRKGAGATVM